jgi:hypothetical protein
MHAVFVKSSTIPTPAAAGAAKERNQTKVSDADPCPV